MVMSCSAVWITHLDEISNCSDAHLMSDSMLWHLVAPYPWLQVDLPVHTLDQPLQAIHHGCRMRASTVNDADMAIVSSGVPAKLSQAFEFLFALHVLSIAKTGRLTLHLSKAQSSHAASSTPLHCI